VTITEDAITPDATDAVPSDYEVLVAEAIHDGPLDILITMSERSISARIAYGEQELEIGRREPDVWTFTHDGADETRRYTLVEILEEATRMLIGRRYE
jgi:hypothetical protein